MGHTYYRVKEEPGDNGTSVWSLTRINRIGMGWGITEYTTKLAADMAARTLNELTYFERYAEQDTYDGPETG